ncbi:dipeptidase [Gordonia sp. LSe1-13]|uniref:Dipeptidase n=1 Tax=Gordonia sesuvii TaxID=3116777 RepID=A0ABU7MF02_9ACTN|nr:dipeptidase [Gordonia sp. LSe1-13]
MTDDALRERVQGLMPQAQSELAEMVAFESVYDPTGTPPEDCDRMVDWLLDTFGELGFDDVESHVTADGSKAVTGHLAGPDDAPTVLLYFHHDVQPPLGADEWDSPVWELTERNGRWYGRGAADCKGNIAVHLTALRALGGDLPVNVKIVGEGSEEQGSGGMEDFVPRNPDLLRADAIIVADSGNFEIGRPSLTTSLRGVANVIVTVETLASAMHSGMFGGAAPDALAALIAMLASLRDENGNTTVRGLDSTETFDGVEYPVDAFRRDAGVLDGVDVIGSGKVADMVWARPAATVLGIDCPPVVGSSAAVQPRARARINLRVPPGMDAKVAQQALIDHLTAVAPWNVRVTIEPEASGSPFSGTTSGPGYDTMVDAMQRTYGSEVLLMGQGGSIPLCNVFAETYPEAEIMLLGVEEPSCLIHAPNESVDPGEIENMAIVEAMFLREYARRAAR